MTLSRMHVFRTTCGENFFAPQSFIIKFQEALSLRADIEKKSLNITNPLPPWSKIKKTLPTPHSQSVKTKKFYCS